jgi:hypothetical protein
VSSALYQVISTVPGEIGGELSVVHGENHKSEEKAVEHAEAPGQQVASGPDFCYTSWVTNSQRNIACTNYMFTAAIC